jgi:hypothetical protein
MKMILDIGTKLAHALMCIAAPVAKLTADEKDKLLADQKKRAKKYGIGVKDATNLTPPEGFPTDPDDYGDPVNYRYPVDDKHIRAALTYFNQPDNRADYTDTEQAIILERIITAALESSEIETVSFQADDPLYDTLPDGIKEQLEGYDKTNKRTPLLETNPGDITPSALQEASPVTLTALHKCLHDQFAAAVSKEDEAPPEEDVIQAHLFVVEEYALRSMEHPAMDDGLDKSLPEEIRNAAPVKVYVPICKRDDEERLVYGVVYSPDVVDAHGDIADAEVIKKMAHLFLGEYAQLDVMHDEDARDDLYVVESYLAPMDFELGGQAITKGSWVLVSKIMNDEIWDKVKAGELAGYSLGGIAIGVLEKAA